VVAITEIKNSNAPLEMTAFALSEATAFSLIRTGIENDCDRSSFSHPDNQCIKLGRHRLCQRKVLCTQAMYASNGKPRIGYHDELLLSITTIFLIGYCF
jgi:hypothetical protein